MMTLVTHSDETMTRVGFVHGLVMVAQITERVLDVDDGRAHLAVTVYPVGGTQSVDWLTAIPETQVIDVVRRDRRLRDVRITDGPRGVVVVDEPGLVLAHGVQYGVEGVERRGVAAWRAVRGRLLGIR